MKFIVLPFEVKRIPDGYRPIECYGDHNGNIVVPIIEPHDSHNCDANGCGTFSHVERLAIQDVSTEQVINMNPISKQVCSDNPETTKRALNGDLSSLTFLIGQALREQKKREETRTNDIS